MATLIATLTLACAGYIVYEIRVVRKKQDKSIDTVANLKADMRIFEKRLSRLEEKEKNV